VLTLKTVGFKFNSCHAIVMLILLILLKRNPLEIRWDFINTWLIRIRQYIHLTINTTKKKIVYPFISMYPILVGFKNNY